MNKHASAVLRDKLAGMIDGYRVSQLLCVAAELRIADLLREGPRGADDIAAAVPADARSVFRLLLALASAGIVEHLGERRFALSPLGEWLRSDRDGSLAPWALLSARMYGAWGDFRDAIATGKGGIGSGYGKGRWERLEQSDGEAAVFHQAMGANSAWLACRLLDAYDFSACRLIVDVGGGNGALVAALLGKFPETRGIVFDLPESVGEATTRLERTGAAARCEIRTGSFFDPVPRGGDLYLLSRVLHDWDDEHAVRILESTRRAMTSGTPLLVIERLLDPDRPSIEATLSDLGMLLMNGGRERSATEFEALLATAGFGMNRVIATGTPLYILEAIAS
jgi:hypothetical protein